MNWLRWLERKLYGDDAPDPEWKAQTPVQKYGKYDADLARQGYLRAMRRAGMVQPFQSPQPARKPAPRSQDQP